MISEEQLRERLARFQSVVTPVKPKKRSDMIGPDSVGAENVRAGNGQFWLRRTHHDPSEPWGAMNWADSCERLADVGVRIPFDEEEARVPLSDCLFIDCETTGLSGGAGTIAFLVAVGCYDKGQFIVDQYFLPEPADEPAMIDHLAARFDNAKAIVTYNGATFDLPLLEGRFLFWRSDPAFRHLPHCDLLHLVRALHKHRIGDCSLGNLEEQILRFARVEDLPGSEVPEVYFEYLRSGQSPLLFSVFEHNRLDVVSLFVYLLWISEGADPISPSLSDPDDLIALARYWFRRRRIAPAIATLDEAQCRVLDHDQRVRATELRAWILKRSHAYDDAHKHWETLASSALTIDVIEEMAKHLEHRRKDYAGALAIVDQGLQSMRFMDAIGKPECADWRERLMHRRDRLQRRLERFSGMGDNR